MVKHSNEVVKLLMVDDDADDRQLFIDAVAEIDQSIEVDTARDGQHALEILQQADYHLPDFIFLDLRMPRYNGQRCLLELKQDNRLRDIPVIIYTTSIEVADSSELQNLGAVHFISKPSDPDEIYYVVSSVLEEQLIAAQKNQK